MKKAFVLIIVLMIIVLGIFFVVKNKTLNTKNLLGVQDENPKAMKEENLQLEEDKLQYEKKFSMTKGEKFAKIGNIVICCDYDKNIYKFDLSKKTGEKLYTAEDGVNSLYFDGEYIYFMPYYYRGKGIYKLSLNGEVEKIFDGASLQLLITDENIYFTKQKGFDDMNQNPQGDLCIMNKNGEEITTLISNIRNAFRIENNKIYYTDNNTKGVYMANMDGTDSVNMATGRTYITQVNKDFLVYIDYSDGESKNVIYLDNNEKKTLGRFGTTIKTENDTIYEFTRKLNNENEYGIDNDATLLKLNRDFEEEFVTRSSLNMLEYIYKNYLYEYKDGSISRINLDNNEEEDIDIGFSYFINGMAYSAYSTENGIDHLTIMNLDTLEKEDIKVNN